MKRIIYILVILVFCSGKRDLAQDRQLKYAFVEWEDFATQTFYDVSCESFKNEFKSTKQKKIFKDRVGVGKLVNLIEQFSAKKEDGGIDVRGQITFVYSNAREKYCFDQFGNFYLDGRLFKNIRLRDFIIKSIYPNGW